MDGYDGEYTYLGPFHLQRATPGVDVGSLERLFRFLRRLERIKLDQDLNTVLAQNDDAVNGAVVSRADRVHHILQCYKGCKHSTQLIM